MKKRIIKYKFNSKKYIRRHSNIELISKINKLMYLLDNKKIIESLELFNNKRKMFTRNLLSGITKGIGTGIGFTIITAIIIYVLQKIIRLNIPIIGRYINDILDIVERQ